MAERPSLSELTAPKAVPDPSPAVVDLSDDSADELLGALASETARQLFRQLRESPTYPSNLADETETTLQNVHYHLGKLETAGAVEVVDTVCSAKGREMNVYAPTAAPLVIVAGTDDDRRDLVETLSELLGAVGVLALGSVVAQRFVERLLYPGGPTPLARAGSQYAVPPTTNVPPPVGLYVFVAGLVVILGWFGWRRW